MAGSGAQSDASGLSLQTVILYGHIFKVKAVMEFTLNCLTADDL